MAMMITIQIIVVPRFRFFSAATGVPPLIVDLPEPPEEEKADRQHDGKQ